MKIFHFHIELVNLRQLHKKWILWLLSILRYSNNLRTYFILFNNAVLLELFWTLRLYHILYDLITQNMV